MLIKNCELKYTEYNDGLYDIYIEDGVIQDIGKDLDYPGKIFNAEGKLVTAGFVEPHCHMGIYETAVPEGMDGNEITNPITIGLRAIDAIDPYDTAYDVALRNGVTTLCCGPGSANIMGGTFAAVKSHGKNLDKRLVKAETSLKMALGENPKFAYGNRHMAPSTRMMSAAMMRENFHKAREYKEQYEAYEKALENGEKPKDFKFDLNMHSLMRAFDGMIVKIHAHQSDDIITAVRIAEEFNLNYTIEHCTEGHLILDYLKEHNVKAILGPVLGGKGKFEVRNKSLENAGMFEKAGMMFAIMTDHPVIPEEAQRMHLSQLIKYGLSRQGAHDAVTINAAKINGIDDRVGELAKGKDGDVVIWDADPFDTYAHADTVLIYGRVVFDRKGQLDDVDYKFS